MANVGLVADGANATTSESFGRFTLEFPQKRPKSIRRGHRETGGIRGRQRGWLGADTPARAEDKFLNIILCKEGDREEMARRFYRLKSFDTIEQTYQKRLKELEETQQATATASTKLTRNATRPRPAQKSWLRKWPKTSQARALNPF